MALFLIYSVSGNSQEYSRFQIEYALSKMLRTENVLSFGIFCENLYTYVYVYVHEYISIHVYTYRRLFFCLSVYLFLGEGTQQHMLGKCFTPGLHSQASCVLTVICHRSVVAFSPCLVVSALGKFWILAFWSRDVQLVYCCLIYEFICGITSLPCNC